MKLVRNGLLYVRQVSPARRVCLNITYVMRTSTREEMFGTFVYTAVHTFSWRRRDVSPGCIYCAAFCDDDRPRTTLRTPYSRYAPTWLPTVCISRSGNHISSHSRMMHIICRLHDDSPSSTYCCCISTRLLHRLRLFYPPLPDFLRTCSRRWYLDIIMSSHQQQRESVTPTQQHPHT